MIHVIYDPLNGVPINDGLLRETVKNWSKNDGIQIVTSSLLAVLMLGQLLEKEKGSTDGLELFFKPIPNHPSEHTDPIMVSTYSPVEELPPEFKRFLDMIMNGLDGEALAA